MNGIAVIIPVYNGEKLIERCVNSLSTAGKRIKEIIIVDDGSTDGTYSIAQEIANRDPRIHVIHTDNHGIYEARRTGIATSTAPYIAFLDIDDRYCHGALDMLAELLENHDADVAMGGIVETDSMDAPEPEHGTATMRDQTPDQMWPRIMKWGTQEFILYTVNKLYKREMLEGLIEADGICQGEDVLITNQVFLKVKKTVETTAPVYLYYQNPASVTHSFGRHDLELIRVWDAVVFLMPEGRLKYMAQVNRWRTDYTLICRLILENDREKDKKYSAKLVKWQTSLKAHWKDLVKILPLNRKLLVFALRFAYLPTKSLMRIAMRLKRGRLH